MTGQLSVALPYQNLSNLGGWWPFDENTGISAQDISGNANNGLLSAGQTPIWAVGKFNSALDFSPGGFVQVPANPTLESQSVSVEAWVKYLGNPGMFKYVVAKGGNADFAASFALYTGNQPNGIGFYVANCGTFIAANTSFPSLWDGNWHRVSGTYDPNASSNNVVTYVDGVAVAQATGSLTIEYNLLNCNPAAFNDLSVGNYLAQTGLLFPGLIDEPRVWSRTLSAAELSSTAGPSIGIPAFSVNPLAAGQSSVLSASDSDSYGVMRAEFSVDAGSGFVTWLPMSLSGLVASASLGASFSPGVYPVQIRSTNYADITNYSSIAYLVIYDPNGGFVTGGGWINSPLGAYVANPSLSGKATFGFASKYQKGSSIPTGNTEFIFHAAGFNFKSTSYQWLIVNQGGTNAQFKGVGTINGGGSYNFMIWATDGSPDTLRIRITDMSGVLIYDNGVQQALGGGSIVIHN